MSFSNGKINNISNYIKMKSFNCSKAWRELIIPAFDSLPQNVRDLLSLTEKISRRLNQNTNLDVSFPTEDNMETWIDNDFLVEEGLALRSRFNKIPSEILAQAAYVVYCFGQWAPHLPKQLDIFESRPIKHLQLAKQLQIHGSYWKFSNYADQVLSDKLALNRQINSQLRGFSFQVREGCLKLYHLNYRGFITSKLGWATKENYKRAQSIQPPSEQDIVLDHLVLDRYMEDVKKLTTSPNYCLLTDTEKFMEK